MATGEPPIAFQLDRAAIDADFDLAGHYPEIDRADGLARGGGGDFHVWFGVTPFGGRAGFHLIGKSSVVGFVDAGFLL